MIAYEINEKGYGGDKPLLVAPENGHYKILQYLVGHENNKNFYNLLDILILLTKSTNI